MKKILLHAIALCLILVISLTALSGCINVRIYTGPYPELCSVAWASLVDVQGYWSDGELSGEAYVEVIETDSYGRVLFSYSERKDYPDGKGGYKEGIYLLVMQSKDADEVRYYPEDCYRFVKVDRLEYGEGYAFDPEVIAGLKTLNDWEKPMDASKCDSTEIVKKKPEGKIKNGEDDAFLEKIIGEYYARSGRYIHPKNASFVSDSSFVTKDDYGRELYTVYSRFDEYTDKCETQYLYRFLLILMPDGSCDENTVIMLDDADNSQNEVKLIKESNNWNKPIE